MMIKTIIVHFPIRRISSPFNAGIFSMSISGLRQAGLALLMVFLLSSCTTSTATSSAPLARSTVPVTMPAPRADSFNQSSGGGEPRTPGYWLIWNACAKGNQAKVAQANGGRAAGWIVMEDLLSDPGVLLGELQVETCQQGVNLLRSMNLQGAVMKGDAAYALASQLLAAQLNLAAGSEYCPASDQAVTAAQLLLLGLGFDGTGKNLTPLSGSQDLKTAEILTGQLASYNSGALCR